MSENNLPVMKEKSSPPSVPDEVIATYLQNFGNNLSPVYRNQFIQICRAFQLNPFLREIYGIPYGDKFNIIVGYEVYLKRAERSGLLAGWKVWTEGEGKDLRGCVEILRKDWSTPFLHEVYFSEYDQGNSMWKAKPRTMIKKVAIAQGFRLAFPEELGGMPFTEEEITNIEEGDKTEKKGKPEVKQPGRKSDKKEGGTITEGQISVLRKQLGNAGVSEMELARYFKVDCLENLPADQINEALALVKTWSNPG